MLNGLSSYIGPISSLVAALLAALTSIVVAIWARRTQKYLLARQSELQKELNQSVESLKDSLERNRSFNVFIRERVITHTDHVLEAYNKVSSLGYLVGRRSLIDAGKFLEGDMEFYTQMYSMKTHLGVLMNLKAIPKDLYDNSLSACWSVEAGWDGVANELTSLSPEFRKQRPNEREFSPEVFNERWGKLLQAMRKLEEAILPIPANISIPK
jgi:hypothetical protein